MDKLVAVKELRILGVDISEAYEKQLRHSMEALREQKALSKKKREKERHVFHEPESDYHFAMIMGCTSGGFPYGVTHEEMEEIMKEEQKRLNNRQK